MLTLVRIAHWRNIPIVWTAHNSVSHARRHPRLERLLWAEFVDRVAAVHYLSESSRLEISRHWPRLKTVPAIVTKHGAYPVARPVPGPKVPEGAFVVAFVGKISHYKGVPDLVAAFDALRGSDVHLLVAGALNPELGDWLERRNRDDTRETWITHLLTEPELAGVYEVADLVVFPYRAVTNSGSVIYALSAGKRVLAPALGSIPEVAATVGPLWLMTYEGKISSKTLEAAICRVRDTPKVDGPDLQAFQWNEIAEAVANFYWKISRRGVG
ncbi:glycosyltransferase [Mycolicibacterium neoaurum]|nr:glycosyltransferase [Mycolicibacterium neoaurum]